MQPANAHRQPVFHGWFVALASGIGLALSIATVVAATFSIFVSPIREEMGWNQSMPFWAPLAVTLTSAFSAPIVGGFVDRLGAKRVLLVSFVFESAILASFYFLTDSIAGFYLRYVLLGLLAIGTTHVAFARVIALWFDRRRGLALGVALAGVGAGGIVLPLLCQWMIAEFGWRMAYVALAALILIIVMPLIGLVLRDSPQAMGLQPDGDRPGEAAATQAGRSGRIAGATHAAAVNFGLSLTQARKTRFFWTMLLTFFLIGVSLQAMMLHLVPLLRQRGMDPSLAAAAQSTIFAGLLAGRLITGWLMDRLFAPRVALAFLIAPVAGIALLALGFSGSIAFLAAALIGIAAGAEVDVIAFLVSRYFGMQQYSRIYGTFYALYSLGGGVGPLLTAQALERTGDYGPVLWVHVGLLLVSALLLTTFGPFPNWAPALAPQRGTTHTA